jgi:hypothetical protein
MKLLETFVAENEALKRANAENANHLAETREELRLGMSLTYLCCADDLTNK